MSLSSPFGAATEEAFFSSKTSTTTTSTGSPKKNTALETKSPVTEEEQHSSTMDSSTEQHVGRRSKVSVNKNVHKERKRRRRSVKSVDICKDFNVYLVNVRGAKSKLVSLKAIADDPQVNPDVINLVETNM